MEAHSHLHRLRIGDEEPGRYLPVDGGASATNQLNTLDATCSVHRRWPKRADVRMDIDPAARPDILADVRQMPFGDGTFSRVYFDPPFNIYRTGSVRDLRVRRTEKAEYQRFGHYENRSAWLDFLLAASHEVRRVLRPRGHWVVKCSHGIRECGAAKGKLTGASIPYTDYLCLAGWALVSDVRVPVRGPFVGAIASRGAKPTWTHYLTFRRT